MGSEYDTMKICLFNYLYCAGSTDKKIGILYELIANSSKKLLNKGINYEDLISKIETLVIIPTLLFANVIE